MFKRLLKIDLPKKQSAFLWGARQTGKSTFLKENFPDSIRYDLLESDTYLKLLKEPYRLREELLTKQKITSPIIIDEVQKVPLLLDEIHWLIENTDYNFILCGSSARKLKRGQANLLGGRAWRFEMFPLVFPEIANTNLLQAFNQGLLPSHYLSSHPSRSLKAYVNDYLTEEIKAEGLTRNLAGFSKFLDAAAFSNTQLVAYKNIASDCGVDAKTVKQYFDILTDTHLGSCLMPLHKKRGRKTISATPKFYFFDVGIANYLTKVTLKELKGPQAGISFENFIHNEIKAYQSYKEKNFDLNFWRTKTGLEVDFILDHDRVYIEAKISTRIRASDLKGLNALMDETRCKRALIVCLENQSRLITNSKGHEIEIMPWDQFLNHLWQGKII